MSLSDCFICNKPVIEIDGQFQDFKIYSLDEKQWIKGVIAAKIIGKNTNDLISTYRTQMAGMADTIKQKFEQAIAG